jgi:ABC-type polysaccharide/polyol phosphate transport system ATPase subunit
MFCGLYHIEETMGNIAISVENLGKMYYIGGNQATYKTIRETMTNGLLAPMRRMRRLLQGQATGAAELNETFWALDDISFDIQHGEVIGIIGPNGAGKSTLLKVLSRITKPTRGRATIHGRVGSLLEVGTGFHPELTGRENIYLNGAILGMHRTEIERKFDEIVEFAEVAKFIDTPVKHYSSGMYLRLAFSVAAHLEPEILLVDEVLAVGDAAFQKKCLGKMGEVSTQGRTVLLVSHNMGSILGLCQRVIWIDAGKLRMFGAADDVVRQYHASIASGQQILGRREAVEIHNVRMYNRLGQETQSFTPGDDIGIEIDFFAKDHYQRPYFLLAIEGRQGRLFSANMYLDGQQPDAIQGEGTIRCTFKNVPLLPQQSYAVQLAIRDSAPGLKSLFNVQDIANFEVFGTLSDYGLTGELADRMAPHTASLVLPYEWHLPDGTQRPVAITSEPQVPLVANS